MLLLLRRVRRVEVQELRGMKIVLVDEKKRGNDQDYRHEGEGHDDARGSSLTPWRGAGYMDMGSLSM